MYFFTHLFISKTLYKHFSGELSLDKKAFAYGNIKPDISRESLHISHTLENYLFFVNEQAKQLIEKETSVKKFSINLGEICHYVCDFFCYYHLDEEIYNKKLHHFFYELRLHYELYKLYYRHKIKISSTLKEPRKNISSIILEMRRDYFLEPDSYKRDIAFAFHTTIWACESILFYMNYPSVLMKESEIETKSLLPVEGGRL
ncbi:MAG: zinc dependent phospholipase C family protein [Anaerocolumna sp.]